MNFAEHIDKSPKRGPDAGTFGVMKKAHSNPRVSGGFAKNESSSYATSSNVSSSHDKWGKDSEGTLAPVIEDELNEHDNSKTDSSMQKSIVEINQQKPDSPKKEVGASRHVRVPSAMDKSILSVAAAHAS